MGKFCSKCRFDNPIKAHYCAKCGTALEKDGIFNKTYIVVSASEYLFLKNKIKRLEDENKDLKHSFFYKLNEYKNVIYSILSIGFVIFFWIYLGGFSSCSSSEETIEIIEKDGKFGIRNNETDQLTVDCEYDSIRHVKKYKADLFLLYSGSKVSIAESTGKLTVQLADSVQDYLKWNLVKVFKNGLQGLLFENGCVMLPCEYKYVIWDRNPNDFADFNYAGDYVGNIIPVKKEGETQWHLLNRQTQSITAQTFISVSQIGRYDLLKVTVKGYKHGIINDQGKMLLPAYYYMISQFFNNRAWIRRNFKADWICINGQCEKVFELPNYYSVGFYSDSLCAIQHNSKVGYIDVNGKMVIPMKYQPAKKENGFQYSTYFYKGKAIVSDGQYIGTLNKNGVFKRDDSLK